MDLNIDVTGIEREERVKWMLSDPRQKSHRCRASERTAAARNNTQSESFLRAQPRRGSYFNQSDVTFRIKIQLNSSTLSRSITGLVTSETRVEAIEVCPSLVIRYT